MGEKKRKKKEESESSDSEMENRERNTKIKKTNVTDEANKVPEYVNSVYISLVDPAKDIRKYVFGLYKQVSGVIGEIGNSRVCRDNRVWVEVTNKGDLSRLLNMNSILNGQEKIKVEPALNVGTSVGMVYAPEIFDQKVEEIKEFSETKYDIINITRMHKGKEKIKTPLLKIIFANKKIPEKIKIGFQIYNVRPYYPPPLRCFECFKIGHTGKTCRNGKRCVKCGEAHTQENCNNPHKCINCNGQHIATDPICEKLKQEKEIVKIKVDRGINYREARQAFNNANNTFKTKLMTNITENKTNKDTEELNNIFTKEVAKIEKHLTPEIKKEIQNVIQNAVQNIVKKVTTHKQNSKEEIENRKHSPQNNTTTTETKQKNTTQDIQKQNTIETSIIKLNNGHKLVTINQKADTNHTNNNNE